MRRDALVRATVAKRGSIRDRNINTVQPAGLRREARL